MKRQREISTDPRSSLEREFDSGTAMDNISLRKLVAILKAERDCMTDNWSSSERARIKLFKSNERWKFFRSFLPFVTNHDLKEQLDKIIMTQDELQASLDTITGTLGTISSQLGKATTEITTEIQTLKDEIAKGPVSDGVAASASRLAAALPALQSAAQALDDLNPDAPTSGTAK